MGLFIPERIRVGYQKRQGTYTGRLAYIIYYDAKGKIRKEVSWKSWRDDEIEPEEFENTPTEGFVLNKDVQRCNWSHFSSNRSYIRLYDPRGIEFEITPGNLIGILMESDCNKRMLFGEFVYAWDGTELLLLPCISESYQEAKKHTARQHQKVSARDLKPGCSYTAKDGKEHIYIGRFMWYTWRDKGREGKKFHIFWNGTYFHRITNMQKLAYCNNEEPVQNYAELVDKLKNNVLSQKIVGVETKPLNLKSISLKKNRWGGPEYQSFFRVDGNEIISCQVSWHRDYNNKTPRFNMYQDKALNTENWSIREVSISGPSYSGWKHHNYKEKDMLRQLKNAVEVHLILESGAKFKLENIGWQLPGYMY